MCRLCLNPVLLRGTWRATPQPIRFTCRKMRRTAAARSAVPPPARNRLPKMAPIMRTKITMEEAINPAAAAPAMGQKVAKMPPNLPAQGRPKVDPAAVVMVVPSRELIRKEQLMRQPIRFLDSSRQPTRNNRQAITVATRASRMASPRADTWENPTRRSRPTPAQVRMISRVKPWMILIFNSQQVKAHIHIKGIEMECLFLT
jgi:hypothetical protein